jgi:hypothetical protein
VITALILAMCQESATPLEALTAAYGFQEENRYSINRDLSRLPKGKSEQLVFLNDRNAARFYLKVEQVKGTPLQLLEGVLSSSVGPVSTAGRITTDRSPIGTAVVPAVGSIIVSMGLCKVGESIDSARSHAIFSQDMATSFSWMPSGYSGRSSTWGPSKEPYAALETASLRWIHSSKAADWAYSDNIQRVAGREMVTKVDKNQNVYVDMNELSRHRGWNFSISLEPARADVRIGNDHIKIYPGADRIHINDELVTLPGTVPTQGYGVYLPLRLLQERGYLPSEG